MTLPLAAHPSIPVDRDILVCVFQRGAADGLNSLAPHGDPEGACIEIAKLSDVVVHETRVT